MNDDEMVEAATTRGVLEIKRELALDRLGFDVWRNAPHSGLTIRSDLGCVMMVAKAESGEVMTARWSAGVALGIAWLFARHALKAWWQQIRRAVR